MNNPGKINISPDTSPVGIPSRLRIRVGFVTTVIGMVILLLGARPTIFGIREKALFGFGEIALMLVGLAVISIGGIICLMAFWTNGSRTLAADIGSRLVATGYVIIFFSGMADIFGITQMTTKTWYFGSWQAVGMQIGEVVIGLGFLLLIPYQRILSKVSEKKIL